MACQGEIGTAERPTEPMAPEPRTHRTESADELCAELGVAAATSPFSRLTRAEYDQTVRDLLGVEGSPADSFPDTLSGGFGFEVGISPAQFELYASAAGDLADAVDPESLFECSTTEHSEGECGQVFIERFGLRAFRRPVPADVAERLGAVFETGLTQGGYENGLRLTLRAMLQSPYFLYKVETDRSTVVAGDIVSLDGWERASRLSYLLWGSMPDDALFDAAAAGQLATAEQVAEQARRMLDDPRAREPVTQLFVDWLHLDLDNERVQGLPEGVPAMMEEETARFIEDLVFDERGSLEDLLTARHTFVNEELAEIYGIEGVSGDEWTRVELDGEERAGVLTHASWLATTAAEGSAAPVFRGLFVRQELLCQQLPEPPGEIPPFSDSGTETDSLRDRLAQHRENPACAGCHTYMDPLGFGFENYDGAGRFQLEGPGGTIDASGEVIDTTDSDGAFYGAVELVERLAVSDDVRQCMANQLLRRALGRLEGGEDACSLRRMDEAFTASGYELQTLLVAVTQTDAFLYRRLGEGEGR